jgi:hypothetical protein
MTIDGVDRAGVFIACGMTTIQSFAKMIGNDVSIAALPAVTGPQVAKLLEERDRLVEALRFYADENTYEPNAEPPFQNGFTPIEVDEGTIARALLAEIGETK